MKDDVGGNVLKTFTVTLVAGGITVSSLSPLSAKVGTSTMFTVNGTNLPSTLQLFIPNCTFATSTSGNASSRWLTCTPQAAGTFTAQVKDDVGGNLLKMFDVTFF